MAFSNTRKGNLVSTWRELDRRPNTHAWQEETETGVITTVRLFNTVIYRRVDGLTVLNTGYYNTMITRQRMNSALKIAGSRYCVSSDRGVAFAFPCGDFSRASRVPFIDGICRLAE